MAQSASIESAVSARFDASALARFSAASRDTNALHMNELYASRSVFGRRVVFGIALLLQALSIYAEKRASFRLTSLKCKFKKPLLIDQDCIFQFSVSGETVTCRVSAATETLAEFVFTVTTWKADSADSAVYAVSVTDERAHRTNSYAVDDVLKLKDLFQWKALPLPLEQVSFLLWTSYFVGMVYPGENALYSSLEVKSFPGTIKGISVTSATEDARFALSRIVGRIDGESMFKIDALHRPAPASVAIDKLKFTSRIQKLRGLQALVIGGSRGFGATLAKLLAVHGCHVDIIFHRNRESAEGVQTEVRSQNVESAIHPCDLNDGDAVLDLQKRLASRYDLAFVNAMPFIEKKPFAAYSTTEFLQKFSGEMELAINSLYLAKSCLKPDGVIVYSSSIYVEKPVAGFSRYIGLKAAVEKILEAISLEDKSQRVMNLRLPKMNTDQTNNPLDLNRRAETADVAAEVLRHLDQFLSDDAALRAETIRPGTADA
jgi:NAD(P)-dependent dehydrogenase (short-subunit alcohol dehydrogenase family)/acyl dehydratase